MVDARSKWDCPNMQVHALGRAIDKSDTDKFVKLSCKKWDCPYCSEVNRKAWYLHIRKGVEHIGGDWSFLTVTAHKQAHAYEKSLENIIGGWDRLMKRLRREWGDFPYVRIYERHKSGQFHAHLLIGHQVDDVWDSKAWRKAWIAKRMRYEWAYRGIGYTTLKRHAQQSGLGFMVDYSPLFESDESGGLLGIVSYVTKYLTKNVGNPMPKGTRRVQASRHFGSLREWQKQSQTHKWQRKGILLLEDILESPRWEIRDITRNHLVTIDDFETELYYPTDDNL